MEYKFIRLTEEYFEDYLKLSMGLSDYLSDLQTFEDERIMWQKKHFFEWQDEFAYLCICENEVVGFIHCCNFHCFNGEYCDSDNIGIINEIFVLPEHGNGSNAYDLLQLGLEELIKNGKTKGIMNVQEDNKNNVFHFAMADTIIKADPCTRRDGSQTVDYCLLISNLEALKNTSLSTLAKRAARINRAGTPIESANLKHKNIFENNETK